MESVIGCSKYFMKHLVLKKELDLNCKLHVGILNFTYFSLVGNILIVLLLVGFFFHLVAVLMWICTECGQCGFLVRRHKADAVLVLKVWGNFF